nr:hypothetical protein [Tanacetum cinerariifolium]
SGTKDAANQEVKKDVSSLRYILLPNWAHDALLESSSSKPHDKSSTKIPEGSRNSNLTASSSNPPADQMETLIVESPIPTVSSPVLTACLNDWKRIRLKRDKSEQKRIRLKREACRSQKKSKVDAVGRARKTEQNAKRMVKNANASQKLFKI